ncbi:MAG: glycosyltransferase [Magnetococcales bacterium]|nr:glycosyltransferase [Magnetococcales bacterium]
MISSERRPDPGKISVILPAYNERDNLLQLIPAIQYELHGRNLEIILVDDNSPDGTADAIREAFSGVPEVRLIVRTEGKGFARSILHGIRESTGDIIIVMDSDFNHQPHYLPFMVDALKYYDLVTGSRFLIGGLMSPRSRHLLSWLFNVCVRLVTGGSITDNLYGFFSCRRGILFRYEKKFDVIFEGFGEYYIRLLYWIQQDGDVTILQFPAINGTRRAGEKNSSFVKLFLSYMAATIACRFKV